MIDRGYLCCNDLISKNYDQINDINNINKMDIDMENDKYTYDYDNIFELDNLNNYNIEPENNNSKEYILTESLDNTDDNEEMENMYNNKEKYYKNNIQDIKNINNQCIYDSCIFNLST